MSREGGISELAARLVLLPHTEQRMWRPGPAVTRYEGVLVGLGWQEPDISRRRPGYPPAVPRSATSTSHSPDRGPQPMPIGSSAIGWLRGRVMGTPDIVNHGSPPRSMSVAFATISAARSFTSR
jgi:hypothetical protein